MAALRPLGQDAQEMDPNSDRLFVTHVPQTMTREDLQIHFSQFGATTDVYLPSVPGFVGHKGIAFVSFQEPSSLQLAMSLGPHEIQGAEVIVDVAAPRSDRGPQAPRHQRWEAAPPPRPSSRPPVRIPPRFPQVSRLQRAETQPREPYRPPPSQVEMQASASDVRLFVTKIPAALQKDMILEHFVQFGELTDVYLPAVPGSSNHKGIAFVSFAEPLGLQAAIRHSPHEIWGHLIVVDFAAPRGGKGGKAPRTFQARPEQVLPAPRFVQPPQHLVQQPLQAAPPTIIAYESPYEQQPPVTQEPEPQMQAEPAVLQPHRSLQEQQQLQQQELQQIQQLQQQQQRLTGFVASAGCVLHVAGGLTQPGGMLSAAVPLPAPGRLGTPVPGRLFVTRVTPDMSKADIQNYFEQFGELLDVFVPNGKGIAFVSFRDPAVAAGVLQAQTHFVKEGKAVVVDQALERPSLGNKGAGRGGNVYLGPPSRQPTASEGVNAIASGDGAWEHSAAMHQRRVSPY